MAERSNAGQVLMWGIGALIALLIAVLVTLPFLGTDATTQGIADLEASSAAAPGPQIVQLMAFLIVAGQYALALLMLAAFVMLWVFLWQVANKESYLAARLDGRPEADPLPRIVQSPSEGD